MPGFSPLEVALFCLACTASLTAFGTRLGRVLRIIGRSRPDRGSSEPGLGRRLRDFLWEVVMQARVIRERRWPGMAHAVVFWGFCAFAPATLDHLGAGFGWDLIPAHSAFGRRYLPAVAVFAGAVAVAILGLAIRRFIVRPRWLGAMSAESGLIAFLIFALMLTYVASLGLEGHSRAGRWNWWLHTALLLVFLPLIPRTKHLHLLLGPLSVFLRRPGFGRIPPLEGDEDYGLLTGKDLTRLSALQAYSCVECGRCTEHCPAAATGKVLNPKEIVLGLRRYLNEHGAGGGAELLDGYASQEAVFQCTTCGACEYQCPVGIQHLPMIIGLRRAATNTGRWEDDYGSRLFLNLERSGNPFGLPASERERFLERAGLPVFDGRQEYCLWLGCMGAYDPRGREIVLALVRLLNLLELSFGVLPKEKCSGDPARRLGNDLAFRELAEFNLAEMRARGVRRLVSICPHCVRTIGEDWRELGAPVRIEHHSELLARHRDRLAQAASGIARFVFHDPCYLSRYRGLCREPRQVAALGGALLDPPRARKRSFCCGAGGGLLFLGEEKGKRVSVERAEELLRARATVAAACPFCKTMLADALSGLSNAPPEVSDIAEIAAAALTHRERCAGQSGGPASDPGVAP